MRVLICAESVSLAHISRSAELARLFNRLGCECLLAYNDAESVPKGLIDRCSTRRFHCLPSKTFLSRIWAGEPPYTLKELEKYTECELQLLERYNPDIVVGDCRPTLEVSCSYYGVPYFPLVNAYWNPAWGHHEAMIPPQSSWNGWDKPRMLDLNLDSIRKASSVAVQPFDDIRHRYGLETHGCFFKLMSSGVAGVFPDTPALYSSHPDDHQGFFIGPLLWSPQIDVDSRWADRSSFDAYVSLGSSGPPQELERLLECLKQLGISAIVSSGGHRGNFDHFKPHGINVFPYVNGALACQKVSFVVCNGGSPGTYQALSMGRPVIGLSSNYDQALNMSVIEQNKLGVLLPLHSLSKEHLGRAIDMVMTDQSLVHRVREFETTLSDFDNLLGVESFLNWFEAKLLSSLQLNTEPIRSAGQL